VPCQEISQFDRSTGKREGDTERLEEAVQAYRAALQERARERVTLEWVAKEKALEQTMVELERRRSP
jgi:hypothetical protein